MNSHLLAPAVQAHIRQLEKADPASVALSRSPFPEVSAAELAQQVDGLQRSKNKLPLWYQQAGIYFPSRLAIEQASSALAAHYKQGLIGHNVELVDLTGGLGVDSYYFSLIAAKVTYCEVQPDLAKIVAHNFNVLHTDNITVHIGDGISYLKQLPAQHIDVAFIDPARRKADKKVFLLSDCEPNMLEQQEMILQHCKTVIIKTSPMLDIKLAISQLRNVKEVHVLSINNECKEVILIQQAGYPLEKIKIQCAILNAKNNKLFSFTYKEEAQSTVSYALPQKYLYEPDVALTKAACFKAVCPRYMLHKLHQHTHLYTATSFKEEFLGRSFLIMQVMDYREFKNEKTVTKANISSRNFPLKPDAIKRKHKIQDGGDLYLFFCTGENDRLLVIFCSKLAKPEAPF